MVKINLLPHEIVERRRWERWYPLVFLVGAVALGIVLTVIVGLFLLVSQQRALLQKTQEDAQRLQTQAEQFQVFEQRESDLQARAATAEKALSGRINWAEICNDLSLILPDEVWLNSLASNPTAGGSTLNITGETPSMDPASPDEGYKSVARTLVRLAAMPQLYDVWLSNATTGQYTVPNTQLTAPIVTFQITSQVHVPPDPPASSAVPAPPSSTSSGQ